MEKNLEKLTVKELRKLAETKGIEVTTSKKAEIIEEINNAEDTVSEEIVQAVAEAIDEEAKEQSKTADEVIQEIKEESEEQEETKGIEVPEGFTRKTNLNKKEYGYHNGRKFLKLKNGYGMWADTGQGFNINDLN